MGKNNKIMIWNHLALSIVHLSDVGLCELIQMVVWSGFLNATPDKEQHLSENVCCRPPGWRKENKYRISFPMCVAVRAPFKVFTSSKGNNNLFLWGWTLDDGQIYSTALLQRQNTTFSYKHKCVWDWDLNDNHTSVKSHWFGGLL